MQPACLVVYHTPCVEQPSTSYCLLLLHMSGMGGDAFALYYDAASRKVHCMQGNGASPARLTLDYVRTTGRIQGTELPTLSALTVAVPGAVALWEDALKDWGKLQLAQVGPAGTLAVVPTATKGPVTGILLLVGLHTYTLLDNQGPLGTSTQTATAGHADRQRGHPAIPVIV
jgi:gamma-glutamyltranspeptidase/glutathione hydrolase